MFFKNKNIVIGVTGGIAAYKSAEIIRLFKKEGAEVRVVMTESAKEFITPLCKLFLVMRFMILF